MERTPPIYRRHYSLASPNTVLVRGDLTAEMIAALENDPGVHVRGHNAIHIPIARYDELQAVGPGEPVPPFAMRAMLRAAGDVPIDWARIPPRIRELALPFQRAGIERGIRAGRILLGDEMGLGKTIQAIGIAAYAAQRTLVLCPASLAEHWTREFSKWTSLRTLWVRKGDQVCDYAAHDVTIVSYGLVGITKSQKSREIRALHWPTVIADESHAFQDHTTQRSTCLGPLLRRADTLLLISGTPQLARPSQLFTQMGALFPDCPDWYEFTGRYCAGHFDKRFGRWDASGSSNLQELHTVLSTRMVRRLQRDVLGSLPPKTRERIDMVLPPADLVTYEAAEMTYDAALKRFRKATTIHPTPDEQAAARRLLNEVKLRKMELYRITAAGKAPEVSERVVCAVQQAWAESRAKTIVFFHHQVMRDAIVGKLKAAGIAHVVIDGGTPPKKRQALVDRVASIDTPELCAALSITACSTGLNFTPAVTRVIFAELHWTPSIQLQGEARAHRIGATKPVLVEYIVAAHTLDEDVMNANVYKFNVNNASIDAGAAASFKLERNDLELYHGHEVAPYGVQHNAELVKVLPLPDEAVGDWIARACVCVEPDDFDVAPHVLPKLHATNELNGDKTAEWANLAEWSGALPVVEPKLWVLGDWPLEPIQRAQALTTSFERAEMLCGLRDAPAISVCAVFAKRV